MTVAASELERLLDHRWPPLLFERVNCRKIAGSKTWSQHSWPGGNGRDIFGPDKRPSPTSQALLDVVAVYLRQNWGKFGIKTLLWRVKDHYNHIHVDLWPTGYGTPPCGGGQERYRYSDKRIVKAQNGNVPPEGKFEEPTMIVYPGEKGNYVRPYQTALNTWAVKQLVPNWTALVEDGNYGPATTAAVVKYQNASELNTKPGIVLGQLDDLTRDLLERYVES